MEIGRRRGWWSGQGKIRGSNLALKPQREGCGNDVYKSSVPGILDTRPDPEREALVATEWTESSEGVSNYFVRSGSKGAVGIETASFLGIFSWALFGPRINETRHEEDGWMVRTKGRDSHLLLAPL